MLVERLGLNLGFIFRLGIGTNQVMVRMPVTTITKINFTNLITKTMKKLFLILLIFAFPFSLKAQKSTIIYLVRHAEKVTSDPNNKDPQLTEKGQKRAIDLANKLKKQKLSSIYVTDFQRTKLTAQPIADKKSLQIKIYNPKDLKAFVETILQENIGKKIMIVGHSNTVLETIEAMGGKRPIEKILDNEYDYFFTVNLSESGLIEVKFEHYGKKNTE
jgi:phosphohistidine phosphatase SixA